MMRGAWRFLLSSSVVGPDRRGDAAVSSPAQPMQAGGWAMPMDSRVGGYDAGRVGGAWGAVVHAGESWVPSGNDRPPVAPPSHSSTELTSSPRIEVLPRRRSSQRRRPAV